MRSGGGRTVLAVLGITTLVALAWMVGGQRTADMPSDHRDVQLPALLRDVRLGALTPTARPTVWPTATLAMPSDLEIIAQLGGTALDVAVAGDHVYVAQGSGLTVYDVRDPADPRPVGRLAPLGGVPVGVDIAGPIVAVVTEPGYFAIGPVGLNIVDVSDPLHPRRVGPVYADGGRGDVVVAGGRAYVGPSFRGSDGALRILDISDPARPRELGRVGLSMPARRLAVDGSRLYAALDVVDVADPANSSLLEPFVPPGSDAPLPSDVAAAGAVVGFTGSETDPTNDLAYIRRAGRGMEPATITQLDCHHDALGIARFAERFLVVGTNGGCVFDAPADGSPPTVQDFAAPGRGTAVTVSGRFGYVATNPDWFVGPHGEDANLTFGGGLQTLDLGNPTAPRVLATVAGPSACITAAVADGDRLIVTDGADWHEFQRLWVLDARNPAAAAPLGVAHLDHMPNGGLAVEDDLLYLSTSDGLEVWDIANPRAPRRVGRAEAFWGVGPRPYRVFKRGGYAYVMSHSDLRTVDVADPALPQVVLETAYDRADDFVAGPIDVGYRLTVDGLQALRLGSGRPEPIGAPLALTADRLAVADTTVYAIDLEGPPGHRPGIQVIDASDPARLRWVTRLDGALPSTEFSQVVAGGDRLYVESPERLMAWDISDRQAPVPAGDMVLPDYGLFARFRSGRDGLSTWGDRLVIAHNVGGITVVVPGR